MDLLKDSEDQKMGEPSAPAGFPDLHDASLSQSSEDQQALMRIQGSWNEHGDTWSSDMKAKILRRLPDVRTTEINKCTPSKHKLYSVEFDFASWVLLRCIYPDQEFPVLKALLVAKHPDIDPYSYVGPDLAKMRKPAMKSWLKGEEAASGSLKTSKPEARLITDEKCGVPEPPGCKPTNLPHPGYSRPFMHYVYDVEFCIGKIRIDTQEGIFFFVKSMKSKLRKAFKKCKFTSHKGSKGMAEGHAASEKIPVLDFKYLESSEFGSSVNDLIPGLSDEQFEELKAYICKMAVTANHPHGSEMQDMHAATGKKIKDMESKIKDGLAKNEKQMCALASELRATIEIAHLEKEALNKLMGTISSPEKVIMSP
ncbi:hypothetical protein ACHAPA_008170 [Fusarium lateritium]